MRGKARWAGQAGGELPVRDRCDIAEDLERLGVRGAAVTRLATCLEASCQSLEPEAYQTVLEAAAAACDTARAVEGERAEHARDVQEIERLMQGFAGELRKLEEGLRIVSAYVVRMQDRATRERGNTLH
jgi:hypothetical protein